MSGLTQLELRIGELRDLAAAVRAKAHGKPSSEVVLIAQQAGAIADRLDALASRVAGWSAPVAAGLEMHARLHRDTGGITATAACDLARGIYRAADLLGAYHEMEACHVGIG